jgi:hypothetical protein
LINGSLNLTRIYFLVFFSTIFISPSSTKYYHPPTLKTCTHVKKKMRKIIFFGKKVSKKPFGQNYKPIHFVATVSLRYFVSKKIFRK